MGSGPLLSIVCPVYNRGHALREAIESVQQQNLEACEVIVVDDGSTDGTAEVAETAFRRWKSEQVGKFEDEPNKVPHFKVIRQKNAGPGAARNNGAAHATGEYLAFLDSDDLWFPWTLEVYRQVIEQENRPSFIAGCPFVFQKASQLDGVAREAVSCTRYPDYLASGQKRRWWGVSSFVVKRSVFHRVGGFTTESVNGEDADLVMKCGAEPGFVQITAPFTFGYRKHEGNITRVFEKNLGGARLQIRNEAQGIYPGGARRARERRAILSRQIRPVAVAALERGEFNVAWELYRATLPWHIALQKWKFVLGFPLKAFTLGMRSPNP